MSQKLTKFTLFPHQLSRSINCQLMMICCVCSDKDVLSDSVHSDILTVDHSKNFHCNLCYDNLFFEDY